MMGSIIGHGAGNITLSGAGTGATWHTGIQPESLLKPFVEMHQYIKARGFNNPQELFEHFEAVARLTNAQSEIVDLIQDDLQQWRKDNANRT